MKRYKFYTDPGHGWLRVPKKDIPTELDAILTPYSFVSKLYVYLEEDQDMGTFLASLREPIEIECKEVDYFNRNRPRIGSGFDGEAYGKFVENNKINREMFKYV